MVSGGLDSTVLAWWLTASRVDHRVLFIDYGQHGAATELATARRVLPRSDAAQILRVDVSAVFAGSSSALIDAPDLWAGAFDRSEMHLEYRNLALLAVAATVAERNGCRSVAPAFIMSNLATTGDTSSAFLEAVATAVELGGATTVVYPFLHLSKAEVIDLGLDLGAPVGETFSCQLAPEVPCGACPNCVDRLEALGAVRTRRYLDD